MISLALPLFLLAHIFPGVLTTSCTVPAERRAWHNLSNDEKLEYIEAELCLMQTPATLGLPGARTKFDELQAIHVLQAYAIHFVGAFMPFHRLFLHAHETALRDTCGYKGYQPYVPCPPRDRLASFFRPHRYWHQPRDAGNFSSSELFDPVYGFGGDGGGDAPASPCITTGPFANYTNALGPAYAISDHCIQRRISDPNSRYAAQNYTDVCLAAPTFEKAWACVEGDIHTAGHFGVGRGIADWVASPGDPLFYMHHAWLDKVYWDWQARDRVPRTSSVGGTNVPVPPTDLPPHVPRWTGAAGDPGNVTTVNHVLNMFGNGPNRTIADVLDIQGGFLCYLYGEP